MNRRIDDDAIARAVAQLDPAPSTMDGDQRRRAELAKARITASAAAGSAGSGTGAHAPHQRGRRRLAVGAGALVSGVAAAVVLPLTLGGGSAFAGWSAVPQPVVGAEAAAAAAKCWRPIALTGDDVATPRIRIAERRGAWTFVALSGDRSAADCLMANDSVGRLGSDGIVAGSSGKRVDPPAPVPADGLDQVTSSETAVDGDTSVFLVQGRVGPDVAGVTVRTRSGLELRASLVDGEFAAWWPAPQQSSRQPAEAWTYVVRLTDGTTREVAPQ